MKPCLIIKAGEKIPALAATPGDDEDWIANGMAMAANEVMVVAPYMGEALPDVDAFSGVVISGSCAMVTDGDGWIEESAAWLREALHYDMPVLGICFGHQLLAHALGGEVDYNPAGIELGSVKVTLHVEGQHDPLLGALPVEFDAQLGHCQSVRSLPDGARLLAASEMEPHQAVAYGKCAWGVQFHPEFDEAIVAHCIDYYREQLQQEGRDTTPLLRGLRPTPESHTLLARFAALLRQTC